MLEYINDFTTDMRIVLLYLLYRGKTQHVSIERASRIYNNFNKIPMLEVFQSSAAGGYVDTCLGVPIQLDLTGMYANVDLYNSGSTMTFNQVAELLRKVAKFA